MAESPPPPKTLDARTNAIRPDLAAAHLAGRVTAERYVAGRRRGVVAASAPLRRRPAADAPLDTEALHGEAVVVYEEKHDFAWGQLERDGYVGYLPTAALGEPVTPTHRVCVLRTHAYPGPSIKLPPRMAISFGANVVVVRRDGNFAVAADGAHYWLRHLAAIETVEPDFVATAERFVGAPYLWGGRTSEGIDCSGLAQTALRAAGIEAPRDSDLQERNLGAVVEGGALRRGDLVFWRGHVGILCDPSTLLHANGFHMLVVKESFAAAKARIVVNGGGEVTAIKRIV
jgi:cell wall-associated NlpC family hydrolase